MKTLTPSQNINFEISPVNNTSINDYNTLKTMNDSYMDSIDKKIKSKHSLALDYLNSLSTKKSNPPNTSLKIDKFIKLKNELLSSILDKSHFSNFKTYSENNSFRTNTRNNTLSGSTSRNSNQDGFKEKLQSILLNPQKSEEIKSKVNENSVINKLYNNESLNQKTKETIDEIFNNLFEKKEKEKEKGKKKKKKNIYENEIIDETSAKYKFKKLKEKKKHDKSYSGNIIYNEDLNNKYITKINPHVDLYDRNNSVENTKKSYQCQRLIHMSKVLNAEINGKKNLNYDFQFFDKNNNFMKDLFALTHERKIKGKLIELSHFEIFPDITRRHKKDDLLEAYAANNLKIISDIKGDLTNKNNKENHNDNQNNINNITKKYQKNEKPTIDIKEEIDIDDLLD